MSRELRQLGFGGDWPGNKPVGVILAVLMAVVGTGVILLYQYEREWPFVQRLYLSTYLATGLARLLRPAGYYTFPAVVDRKIGPRLATTGEVVPVRLPNGQPGLALTEWAARHGAVRLEWQ